MLHIRKEILWKSFLNDLVIYSHSIALTILLKCRTGMKYTYIFHIYRFDINRFSQFKVAENRKLSF